MNNILERLMPLTTETISLSGDEPVTLVEAKSQLRVVDSEQDTYISALISAARQQVENLTRRAIPLQTFAAYFGIEQRQDQYIYAYWYRPYDLAHLQLPRPPFVSIQSLKYKDSTGTLNDYTGVIQSGKNGAGCAADWNPPAGFDNTQPSSVEVQFTAGYVNPPPALKQAILLLVSHLFESRVPVSDVMGKQVEIPFSVSSLIQPYTVPNL